MTPQPSRPSSGQSTRSITVDPQHSRPRTATAPEMATGMVPGIPRRGRDYVPASRTEKERHAARLRSQDFELAAISVKAGPPPSKEEFERGRNEARQRKMASDLEAAFEGEGEEEARRPGTPVCGHRSSIRSSVDSLSLEAAEV